MRRVVADLPLGAWTHLAHHLPNPKRHYEIPKNKSAPSPVLIIGFGLMLADMAAAQTFTTLHSFTGRDGDGPQAGLILSGSTLYGVADSGGGSFDGTVFKINTNGTGFTTLHTFTALHNDTNSDGAYPDGNLTLSGNTLYGTAFNGGTSGNGTVFKVNTNGTGFTTLHSFTGGSDGETPEGLLLSGNTLYGTAVSFISGNGTVFKINTNGTGYAILHTFTIMNFTGFPNGGPTSDPNYTNSGGAFPSSLTSVGNTLYGTTFYGGSSGNGTVFKPSTDGTGFTNLHSFAASFTNSEGTHPIQFTGLILSGSTLYGATAYGGDSGNGTVFGLNTNGTEFTILHSFTETDPSDDSNSDGANPQGGLMLSGAQGRAQYFILQMENRHRKFGAPDNAT